MSIQIHCLTALLLILGEFESNYTCRSSWADVLCSFADLPLALARSTLRMSRVRIIFLKWDGFFTIRNREMQSPSPGP